MSKTDFQYTDLVGMPEMRPSKGGYPPVSIRMKKCSIQISIVNRDKLPLIKVKTGAWRSYSLVIFVLFMLV